MENLDTAPVTTSPDVLVRTITLTSSDDAGLQWDVKIDGISRMELPIILRLCANMAEKAITGG